MRSAVNNYMETIGANFMPMNGEGGLIDHRKITAQGIAIDRIYKLSSAQLSIVDREMDRIVKDIPR